MPTMREKLHAKVEAFYKEHDPSRLKTPIEPIVNYALTEGMVLLNKVLMKKYGAQITLDSESEEDSSMNDRNALRRQIEFFYLKHDACKLDKSANVEFILEWTLLYGVAKLNIKLKEKYQEDLFQATEKDAVEAVARYYKSQDLEKTKKDHLALVEWGTQHTFCALNTRLINKYGKGFGEMDRERKKEELKTKLKDFYSRHDQKQIEDEKNLRYIVDWAMKHGIGQLNNKLQAKYDANLNTIPVEKKVAKKEKRKQIQSIVVNRESKETAEKDEQRLEDIRVYATFFYAKHDQERVTTGGVDTLARLLTLNGEEEVNQVLRKKYNEDLKDIEKQYKGLEQRLLQFFKLFDEDILDHPLDSFIGWAIVHGEDKLNLKLMRKYDEDLDGSGLKQRLRLFYEQLEEEKTEEELDEIARWTLKKGHGRLNNRLKKKYGKCLEDMFITEGVLEDEEHEGYSVHTRNGSYTTVQSSVVGERSVVPGSRKTFPDKGPSTIENIKRYQNSKGEPIDQSMPNLASKNTLRTINGEDIRTERQGKGELEQVDLIAEGEDSMDFRNTNRKSLKMLRKRRPSTRPVVVPSGNMLSKLSRFLDHVDTLHDKDQQSHGPAPPQSSTWSRKSREDESGSFSFKMGKNGTVVQDNVRITDVKQKTLKLNKARNSQKRTSQKRTSHTRKVKHNSITITKEKEAATSLVNRLRKFYQRHDGSKAVSGKVIRGDVEFVLENGIGALNSKLQQKYGESLNSIDLTERKESKREVKRAKRITNRRKKPLRAVRSKRNFEEMSIAQLDQLNKMM